MEELVLQKRARDLKGIGKTTWEIIQEYYDSGQIALQQELLSQIPAGLWELLEVPGLGSKRVRTLYEVLDISNLSELEYACHENRLLELKGFGPKLQGKILEGLRWVRSRKGQALLPEAEEIAASWLAQVRQWPGVVRAEITGDVRRAAPFTDTIALLMATAAPEAALLQTAVDTVPEAAWTSIVGSTPTQLQARLPDGPQLSLYLCQPDEFAYHWLLTTGSEAHLAALQDSGLASLPLLAAADEAAIYQQLGLSFIPPVLREDGQEVAWARADGLPNLLQMSDLAGVLHVHTTYSDGAHSLAAMAAAAADRGWSYLGISDHSQAASYAGGLSPAEVRRQWQEIDAFNNEQPATRLLKGIEVDILPDGRLDYDDDLLAGFDFVIASVHSSLRQPAAQMMPRLLAALRHPAVTMLGHPTNRLLLGREESAVDMACLLAEAARYGKALELNANPHRLDLDWRWCRAAKQAGVKIAINPDAHRSSGLDDVRYGVLMAQKAGLTPADIYQLQ